MNDDLRDRENIAPLVTMVYRTALCDPLIGPIFADVAHLGLARHVPIMCDLWQTVRLKAAIHRRNALQLHSMLHAERPLDAWHFNRWLQPRPAAVDALLAGEKAGPIRLRAQRAGGSMLCCLEGRSGSEFETIGLREGSA